MQRRASRSGSLGPGESPRAASAILWREGWEHPANLPLLLPASSRQGSSALCEDDLDEDAEQQLAGGMVSDCKHILVIGGPLFIEGVAAIGQQLVATSCVGRLPSGAQLSALMLAQSLYAVTGYSLVSGLASALETLCGQAYGAGNLAMMAATLVRAQLVCGLAILPTLLLYGSGALSWLLTRLGQQPDIAQPASRLLQLMSPALVLSVLSESVAQYLLSKGRAWPIMASSLVGLLLAPLLYWGFVFWAGAGLMGAALAVVGIQGSLVLLLLGYLLASECSSGRRRGAAGWQGFSVLEALQGWLTYLHFGLPCVLMVCLEWWMWEVIVFLAGLLPDAAVAVAVTGISTQIQSLPWILSYSLGTATATRVAQALGAGHADRAARLYRSACVLVLLCSGAMCAAMWLSRAWIAAALTSNAAVQKQLQQVLPVVVATIILDGQAAVMGGVLRGAGRQGLGASVSWGSYWVVGLPLAWLLAFRAGLGVVGLRLALAAAVAVQALLLGVYGCCRMDFGAEVQRAKALVAADTYPASPAAAAAASPPSGHHGAAAGAGGDDAADGSAAAAAGQDVCVVVGEGADGAVSETEQQLRKPLLSSSR